MFFTIMSESQPTKRKSTKEHDSAKFLLAFHLIHDVAKSFDPILLFINHISERADVGKLIPHIIKNVKEQWNVNIQDVVIYRPRSEVRIFHAYACVANSTHCLGDLRPRYRCRLDIGGRNNCELETCRSKGGIVPENTRKV